MICYFNLLLKYFWYNNKIYSLKAFDFSVFLFRKIIEKFYMKFTISL